MGLEIPPLSIKIVLESNPLKSTMLGGGSAVVLVLVSERQSSWMEEETLAEEERVLALQAEITYYKQNIYIN